MSLADGPVLALAALCLELLVGYPGWLFVRIGHPVTWIGRAITAAEARWNGEERDFASRKESGVTLLVVLVAGSLAIGWILQSVFSGLPGGIAVLALGTSSLYAQRSLDTHVADVRRGLIRSLDEGRSAVAMIVGRNPQALDEAGVARAAIESLAENFSDGIVAPILWTVLLGLPGGLAYKAVNTADSMIGHKTPRFLAFGRASARFDDLVNLPASRLSAVLLVAAACIVPGASPQGAIRALRRDARRHRSPNAGWPEAAMAGALGLKLNGPRVYGDTLVDDAYMGDGRGDAGPHDIAKALVLYRTALGIVALGLAIIVAALMTGV